MEFRPFSATYGDTFTAHTILFLGGEEVKAEFNLHKLEALGTQFHAGPLPPCFPDSPRALEKPPNCLP